MLLKGSFHPVQLPIDLGVSEAGNISLGFIKYGKFVDQLK
jgi:hypothetical protein